MIKERTITSLLAARARGRKSGCLMIAEKLSLTMSVMGNVEAQIGYLCEELSITRQILYRLVSLNAKLRDDRKKLLGLV